MQTLCLRVGIGFAFVFAESRVGGFNRETEDGCFYHEGQESAKSNDRYHQVLLVLVCTEGTKGTDGKQFNIFLKLYLQTIFDYLPKVHVYNSIPRYCLLPPLWK